MDPTVETLQIELEAVRVTSWWASILRTLTSQHGSPLMRFVARPPAPPGYTSATFIVPATPGSPMDPQEAWVPGMTRSLTELCDELERDGWVATGAGDHSWSIVYERVVPGAARRGAEHTDPAPR